MAGKPNDKKSLDQRVLGFIREHHLTTRGQTLLVAVSGGQDSVCLLHLLHELQPELGVKLQVAHLDHQLRGKASSGDARYVAGLAKSLGIPATIGKRDVLVYRKKHGLSLEEAAREVRYQFFAETAAATGAAAIAVGHTLDDHVETILLHLVRGSGTRGLRGLQPVTRRNVSGRELRSGPSAADGAPYGDRGILCPFPVAAAAGCVQFVAGAVKEPRPAGIITAFDRI